MTALLHLGLATDGSATGIVAYLTVFVLAAFVGIEVVSKVPSILHTPLMSGSNAIHGIVLVGALLIGVTAHNLVGYILAFVATVFASANVVGGYVVTGRMLKMFRRKAPEPAPELESMNGHKGLRGMLSRAGKAQSGDSA